ncbi:MAG: hypothetical protein IKT41_02255 [Clostridia bacterium]|nr:hypothetical protein [Clostridia bacterium]
MKDKVNPHTLRVGVIRNWESKWVPEKEQNDDKNNQKKEEGKSRTNE